MKMIKLFKNERDEFINSLGYMNEMDTSIISSISFGAMDVLVNTTTTHYQIKHILQNVLLEKSQRR